MTRTPPDDDTDDWLAAYTATLHRLQYEEEMKARQMIQTKFLSKEDVQPAKLLTVREFKNENVAGDSQAPERKWVMYFHEVTKGLVLNPVNIQLASNAFATDETDQWIGRKIVLFVDPTIVMKGQVVGGVRVRAPRTAAQTTARPAGAPAPPPPPPEPELPEPEYPEATGDPGAPFDDDIPF